MIDCPSPNGARVLPQAYFVIVWKQWQAPDCCSSLHTHLRCLFSSRMPASVAHLLLGFVLLGAAWGGACQAGVPFSEGCGNSSFVHVAPDRKGFQLDGRPFVAVGGVCLGKAGRGLATWAMLYTSYHPRQDCPYGQVGANAYYLVAAAADVSGTRSRADATLDAAASLGLNLIRTGAHADGSDQWQAMQPAPGQYDERVRLLPFRQPFPVAGLLCVTGEAA